MQAEERRKEILKKLTEVDLPCSASSLASDYGVSRQIIVGDIALLRAGGAEITATPKGYVLKKDSADIVKKIVCRHHTAAQMQLELYDIVDLGGTVLDVIVEHPIYGELTGQLHLSSRFEVDEFISRCKEENAAPLSSLTGGIHVHTIQCPNKAAFNRITAALDRHGILYHG